MSMLATGLLIWVVVHLFPTLLPKQRQKLISSIGDKAYQGIWSGAADRTRWRTRPAPVYPLAV